MHQLTSFAIVVNGNQKIIENCSFQFIEIDMKTGCLKMKLYILYLPLYNCPKTTRTAVYTAVQCVHLLSYFTMCEVYSSLLGFYRTIAVPIENCVSA